MTLYRTEWYNSIPVYYNKLDTNMTQPQVTWEYSPHTEAQRIVFIAQLIKSYFYQKQGFTVLPTEQTYKEHAIYFPDLPIIHTQSFWDEIQVGDCSRLSVSPSLNMRLIESITPFCAPPPTQLHQEVDLLFPQIFERLSQFIPKIVTPFRQIEIRQTRFGSEGSSIRESNEDEHMARIYVRFDQNISAVVVAFLIRAIDNTPAGTFPSMRWEEKQSLIDFIVRDTSIAELVPHKKGTLVTLREDTDADLKRKSDQFLTTLGFPSRQLFSETTPGTILLNDTPIAFKQKEFQVMSLLVKKRHTIVSINEVAAALWNNESSDRYSLYAISKVIERIRKTIKACGIFPGIIETHRGQGFLLND